MNIQDEEDAGKMLVVVAVGGERQGGEELQCTLVVFSQHSSNEE